MGASKEALTGRGCRLADALESVSESAFRLATARISSTVLVQMKGTQRSFQASMNRGFVLVASRTEANEARRMVLTGHQTLVGAVLAVPLGLGLIKVSTSARQTFY